MSVSGDINLELCGDVWGTMLQELQEFDSIVHQAVQNFGGAVDKSLSATTRKRMSAKSLQGLTNWRSKLGNLISRLSTLKHASQHWQELVRQADESRRNATGQLGEVMSDLQSTMDKLRIEQAEKNASLREVHDLEKQLHDCSEENRRLLALLQERAEQIKTQSFVTDEAQTSLHEMKKETEGLREVTETANKRASMAEEIVDGLREEASKAKELAERQQEVVAKLTADNLVFMMKLKQAEDQLQATTAERDSFKLAVEEHKGPWFDEVRCGVESRVKDAMSQAQGLEEQMSRLRLLHKEQLADVSGEKESLRRRVREMKKMIEEVESHKTAAEESAARLRVEKESAVKSSTELNRRVQELEAEVKVMSESMRCTREENSQIWTKEQQYMASIQSLQSELESCKESLIGREQNLGDMKQQLDVQISVNREVMRRKEHVEWDLMELRARLVNHITRLLKRKTRIG